MHACLACAPAVFLSVWVLVLAVRMLVAPFSPCEIGGASKRSGPVTPKPTSSRCPASWQPVGRVSTAVRHSCILSLQCCSTRCTQNGFVHMIGGPQACFGSLLCWPRLTKAGPWSGRLVHTLSLLAATDTAFCCWPTDTYTHWNVAGDASACSGSCCLPSRQGCGMLRSQECCCLCQRLVALLIRWHRQVMEGEIEAMFVCTVVCCVSVVFMPLLSFLKAWAVGGAVQAPPQLQLSVGVVVPSTCVVNVPGKPCVVTHLCGLMQACQNIMQTLPCCWCLAANVLLFGVGQAITS